MSATRTASTPANRPGPRPFDVARVRADFPILEQRINNHPLVYLDSAATTQKPRQVLDAIRDYYETQNANIHRGVHTLSLRATDAFEHARATVQRFINAALPSEIVFVRGATEAINLVAQSWGRTTLKPGDEILITELEHHSNIVPWQILCEQTGAILRVAPINDAGEVRIDEFERLLGPRTRLAAFAHISNALGTINPVARMTAAAHHAGSLVLIDAAQSAPHAPIDVRSIDCDFLVFSSHKLYGPTGIGALYGRKSLLDAMPPYQGGGEMISTVTFAKTEYNVVPHKFEAGTPDISGAIGLGAAIDYLQSIGLDAIAAHENNLLEYGTHLLRAIPEVRLIGTAREKAAILSFTVEGIHPHDLGTILDQEGVAVRTGQHCAQPVMDHFGIPATARASLALYNTREELDALAAAIGRALEVFR